MKFALLSHILPPSTSGQAVVIQRILRDFDPGDYCLISPESDAGAEESHPGRLKAKYYYLPPPFRIQRGHRLGLVHLREGVNLPLAIWQYAQLLRNIIESERCEAVVACTGDVTLLPAAYLASRRACVPFYAYMFDHYSYREWADPAASFWARRFEPLLMKGAAAVISPNEVLSDDLRARFRIEPILIYNPLDITPYEEAVTLEPENDEIRIVYTGAIYEAHYDAFRNLMSAIESLRRPGVRLHLYTNRSVEALASLGISGSLVCHPQLAASEMPRVQMEADILFLPLAFESPYPDLIRTSATTKLGEYLAARRPVLVHAPRDSFVSWYLRKHDCGVVVDENNPALLAAGLARLLDDDELRDRQTANAWTRAHTDFTVEKSREAFVRLIGVNGAQP
jgi:glycosyltransferase involved in cell wall biosynthesis